MARLLLMPAVAANAVEAVLSDWPVAETAQFAAGDAIATVETEKAVVDVPAETGGVILRRLVEVGASVEVGAPIALIGDLGEAVDDVDAVLAALGVAVVGVAPAGRVFASPLARRLAKDAGLALTELLGTGPGGRVVRRDVERAIAARATAPLTQPTAPATVHAVPAAPAAAAPASRAPGPTGGPAAPDQPPAYEDVPHSRMRRAIAARLTESTREAPHFFLSGTARVDKLLRMRQRLNDHGTVRVSVNDLVVVAAARTHVLVPAMNVVWMPDAVRRFTGVDVAVAVRTDRGLVTPVLRGVDTMTLSAVAVASRDLVERARSGQLREDELVGGSLTVTNLGSYGTEAFSAIINPPQSAMLAVGAAREEPVVRSGKLKVAKVMHVTLSVDHRPVDGADAAEWMAAFLALLEEPVRILA